MQKHQLIAHRGWQQRFPENTLLAVEQALLLGARHIEIDVRLNADKRPYLHHDANLQRICGIDSDIHQLSTEVLAQYHASEPERFGDKYAQQPINTLEEFSSLLAQYPNVKAYIEIKDSADQYWSSEEILSAISPTLQQVESQCTIISFDWQILANISTLPIGAIIRTSSQLDSPELKALQPDIVFCNYKKLPRNFDPKNFPYPLACYEIADIHLAKKLVARGVSLIETFAIGEMMEALQQEALTSNNVHEQ